MSKSQDQNVVVQIQNVDLFTGLGMAFTALVRGFVRLCVTGDKTIQVVEEVVDTCHDSTRIMRARSLKNNAQVFEELGINKPTM